jgi:hypothetical protein
LLLLWLLRRREHSSSLVESKPDAE